MVFHLSLGDWKSAQVSRTLLSILTDYNTTVVWMVSAGPLISKSSNICTNPLVTVPSAPIIIGITVTFIFHSFFFSSLARFLFLISLFTFFQFYTMTRRDGKVLFFFFFFFLPCWLSLCLVVWPRLGDRFVSQNPKEVCASHSPGLILGFTYTSCSYGHIIIIIIINPSG